MRDKVLCKLHHAVIVRVRLIRLDGRKLGVVHGVHALVAEQPADLVDALQAAYDTFL
jgi:hypothetical protein